jgi:hypothetical protein
MWKAVAVLATALSLPAFAANFWQTKAPETWSERELNQLRTKSPWAIREPQERRERTTETVERATAQPPRKQKGGAGPGTTRKQTRTRTGWARVAEAQIRWESAAPMALAAARIDTRWGATLGALVKDYYVVSISGLTLPEEFATPDSVVSELKRRSILRLGERVVRPHLVKAVDWGNGPMYLLQFSRDGTLEQYTKDIELETHLGTTRVQGKFEPKRMVFRGQPAL